MLGLSVTQRAQVPRYVKVLGPAYYVHNGFWDLHSIPSHWGTCTLRVKERLLYLKDPALLEGLHDRYDVILGDLWRLEFSL